MSQEKYTNCTCISNSNSGKIIVDPKNCKVTRKEHICICDDRKKGQRCLALRHMHMDQKYGFFHIENKKK